MENTQWLLIILLVLLIGVGIWMLTRKPASGPDRSQPTGEESSESGVSSYSPGGEHVAAGDAGASAPGPALYDQEADVRAEDDLSAQDDSGFGGPDDDDQVWDPAQASQKGARQDTATGADVTIVEEEPVVSEPETGSAQGPYDQHDADEHDDRIIPADSGDPGDYDDQGDREQMSYGDPQVEDFASETTYADAPASGTAMPAPRDPEDVYGSDEARDLDAGSPGTSAHEEMLELENERALEAGGPDDAVVVEDDQHQRSSQDTYIHPGAGSENLGPEEGEGDSGEVPDPDQGHPGPSSQPGEEATYDAPLSHGEGSENVGPEDGEGDAPEHRDPDQGSPGPGSQADEEDATYGIPAEATEHEDDDVPENAAAAGFAGAAGATAMTRDRSTDADQDVAIHDDSLDRDDIDRRDESDGVEGSLATTGEEGRTDEVEPEIVMVDVEDYGAAPSEQRDAVTDEDHVSDHHVSGERVETHDDTRDRAPEDSDQDHQTAEHDESHEAAEHAEPEAVMVDVEDYPATSTDEDAGTRSPEHSEDGYEDRESVVEDRESLDSDRESVDDDRESVGDEQPISEEPAEPAVVATPYGPGSVFPNEDGSVPSGFDIKGNAGSMLFHTPESPSYDSSVPEVYFESEEAARSAGFAHWDRKRR
ncbi:MAG: hypothetical protein WA962_06455 [Ornithinimicrobium sp.]